MANFFKKLTSRPMLMWKLGAGLLFLGIAAAFYFDPGIIGSNNKNTRTTTQLFSVLFALYGAYRLVTFYLDIKNMDNDE